jgi:carbon-monoxide dehydrogenase medium subunit
LYPSPFTYVRATSIEEALDLFAQYEDAAFLAGGHTLIPAMKNRLASPSALVDLRAISDLHGISLDGDILMIGAATTHAAVAASEIVRKAIPALALLAGSIADPQVRNAGTMGGSVANNDPSADYPSAVLGLGATIVTTTRRIVADDFFVGLFTTALESGEIIIRFEIPVPLSAGYAKFCSQASRYAMAGCFVSRNTDRVRVAITGSGQDGVFRWQAAEAALTERFAAETLHDVIPDSGELVTDLHGDARYRAFLVAEVTRRAVSNMGSVYLR